LLTVARVVELEQWYLIQGRVYGYVPRRRMPGLGPRFVCCISLAKTGMSGCEWADARRHAEKLWIESGFTLTKEQLLEKVGMTLPQPEMEPEDLFA